MSSLIKSSSLTHTKSMKLTKESLPKYNQEWSSNKKVMLILDAEMLSVELDNKKEDLEEPQ